MAGSLLGPAFYFLCRVIKVSEINRVLFPALNLANLKSLKMLDLQTKSAINKDNIQV